MLRTISPLTLIILSILIIGCANHTSSDQDQLDIHIIEQTENESTDSEPALIEAEDKYDTALKANMAFYSPQTIQQAKEALKFARSKELNADKEASLKASRNVLSLLTSAQKNKTKVEELLKNILVQKKILDDLKTPRVLTAEYNAQINKIKKVIQKIEIDKESEILTDIDDIYSELQTLELNTLLAIHWLPAKNTLSKAEEEGAKKFAEKSFSLASTTINNAENLIRSDYKDRSKVEINGITALRAAQKALYTARDAEFLSGLTQAEAESAVLRFQDLMAKIGAALKSKDVRHMALEDQANALAQIAETQGSRLSANLNEKITHLEEQIKQLKIKQSSMIEQNSVIKEEATAK